MVLDEWMDGWMDEWMGRWVDLIDPDYQIAYNRDRIDF